MTNTNTNTLALINADLDKFLSGTQQAKRALPHMVVTLVTNHRDSVDGNPVIAIHPTSTTDDTLDGITYAMVKDWALNTEALSQEHHKKFVTKIKTGLFASTAKGAALLKSIDAANEALKDLKGSTDPFKVAEGNALKAQRDDDISTRNAAYKAIERAMFAYVYIVETTDRAIIKTLAMAKRGVNVTYEVTKTVEGTEKTVTMIAPLATYAANLKAEYIKWNMSEEEQRAAVKEQTAVIEDKRAPQTDTASSADVALNGVAAMKGGEIALLARAASMIARFDEETPPKGEVRDQLLHIAAALRHVFTASQVDAFEKKNA